MITEDYVNFEIAKLLKEKGFDEICRAFWKEWNGEISFCGCNSSHTFEYCHNTMLENYNDSEETNIAAPTLQMAMKWLREVHKLHFWIANKLKQNKGLPWYYEIHNIETGTVVKIGDVGCGSYEVACDAAIMYCLENLI